MVIATDGKLVKSNRGRVVRQSVASTWGRLKSGVLGRGAISFLFATAGVNASNFLFHIVVSRALGPDHYGAIGALLTILTLLSVPVGAAQLAVTQAVIKSESGDSRFSLRRVVLRALLAGFVAMLVLTTMTPVFEDFLHIASPLPIILVDTWIPLATVGAALQGALIGKYRFREVAFATFMGGGPVRLLVGATMVWVGLGVGGAIAATIVAQLFTTGSLLFSARTDLRTDQSREADRVSGRDVTLSIAALGGYTALMGIDTFLARHYFTPFTSGQYAAGAVAAHIALFVPGAIVTVAFPHLADGSGVSARSRKIFLQTLFITTVLGIVVAGVLTAGSSFLVRLLFGVSYSNAVAVIGPLSFASASLGVLSIFIYYHLARRSLCALISWAGVALAVVLIWILHDSMTAVALVMLFVISATLLIAAFPALRSFAAAAARDAAKEKEFGEFPPSEIDLTIVVPFYNPGSALGRHIKNLIEVLTDSDISFEILAVSDGSTDHSEDELSMLACDQLTLLRFDENRGKGAVLWDGLTRGRGEYLGFVDGDGDLPAPLVKEFLEVVRSERPDIVYGSKRHPDSRVIYPPLRHAYSWTYQQLNRALFHLPIRDTQTGIKLFRRDVLVSVLPLMVEKRFAFDLELFVVARRRGFRNFHEMPVVIGERFTSTISPRAVRNMLLDTFAIFYRLRFLRFYDRDVKPIPPGLRSIASHIESLVPRSEKVESRLTEGQEKRLRILILNWRDLAHPKAGGAEVYTHNVAVELTRLGHVVTLFSAGVDGMPAQEIVDGLNIIRRGTHLSVYRLARRYYQREGRGRFDVVIDEINTRPFFAPRWVDDAVVIALIHQVCREVWYYQMPRLFAFFGRYWFEPKWLRQYREVPTVTVSESSRESLVKYGLKHVTIVPEGYRSIERLPETTRESKPTIVFVGRLAANKRPEEAIRAFAMLRENLPTAVLWVIGTGPMEAKLRDGSPDGVEFLGRVTEAEKHERLARAHAIIVTSVREGWGLVVTEAANLGTPAIAYDVPGLRDSVRASGGVLVEPSPEALATELRQRIPKWMKSPPDVAVSDVLPWEHVAIQMIDLAKDSANATHSSKIGAVFLSAQSEGG